MKVAQILYSGVGGHGSVVFSLVAGDGQKRWSNVLGFLGIEPLLPEYRSRCEQAGLPYRYFPARAGRPWSQWRAIRGWLAAERPDAIINHSATAFVPCVLHAAARRTLLVHVEHTPIATKSRQEWLASRLAMLTADRVVMLTPDYERLSRKRLGRWMPRDKVTIIPNGIDLDRFAPTVPRPGAGPKLRVGMAARFSNAKRQDLLVEVVRTLQRDDPRVEWQLTLAGEGEERERVEALAQLTPAHVDFAGLLDEDGLIKWFQSLDIYAHASDGETLSTSILQAMACQLPIVASDVEGIRNLLAPNKGVLAPNEDIGRWRDAILAFYSRPDQAARTAEAARAVMLERYSAAVMHRRYHQLLRELSFSRP